MLTGGKWVEKIKQGRRMRSGRDEVRSEKGRGILKSSNLPNFGGVS